MTISLLHPTSENSVKRKSDFLAFPFLEGGWIGRSLHTRYALSYNPISGGNRTA
jgi:hypothetical protein